MSEDDSGLVWVAGICLWGIPIVIWIIAIAFEWEGWQLVILAILKRILPPLGIMGYIWITER